MTYTKSQIRENRMKWINFLMAKGRRKATGCLDSGKGKRCCLGHGCYALGMRPTLIRNRFNYDGDECYAPLSFMEQVGLYHNDGRSFSGNWIEIKKNMKFANLASANDAIDAIPTNGEDSIEVNITPREIGKYLLSVIEGGEDTPWKRLSDYSD